MTEYKHGEAAREAYQRYLDHLARESSDTVTTSHLTLIAISKQFSCEVIDAIADAHWQAVKEGKTAEYKLYEC